MSKGSDKWKNLKVWFSEVKKMDQLCLIDECGMQAQIILHGGLIVNEMPLCNFHCSDILSSFENIEMIEESLGPDFIDPIIAIERLRNQPKWLAVLVER